MKRLLILFLAVLMLISLSSCEESSSKGDSSSSRKKDAASDGSSSSALFSPEPETEGIWIRKDFVDEFGDPTGEGYITNTSILSGSFSNSFAKDDELNVSFIITEDDVAIALFEYGWNRVTETWGDSVEYTIKIKTDSGDITQMTGKMYANTDRIFIVNSDEETLLSIMKENKTVKFAIQNNKYTSTSYTFAVESSNLKEALKQIGR